MTRHSWMATRAVAGGLLLVSGLIAGLAIYFTLVARLLQAAIALSNVYVAYLAWRGWRVMVRASEAREAGSGVAGDGVDLPFVSVLVPARDEASVIRRLVDDLLAQRYGVAADPRYEVVVVDDGSTDGTADLIRAAARTAPDRLRLVERPDQRFHLKGAVLADGMPAVRGEVVVALDADARIDPHFLRRAMRAWERDPEAVAIQVQRREQNERSSWLTHGQHDEQLMDMASQCGRWATDGTAELRGNGMFVRVSALAAVGGWSTAAITEDLDLSTRLAAAGKRIALAPEASVFEEAVESLAALWHQRMRWAEGSMRRLMEHAPGLLGGPLPLGRKLDFLAFLAEFAVPPLFAASIVASLLSIPLPPETDWTVPVSLFIGYGVGTFVLALAGLAADGRRGVGLVGESARGALFLSHWLLIVPGALVRIAFGPARPAFRKTVRIGRDDR